MPCCAVVTNNDGRPVATSGEVETLRREWARHEQVMRSIADTRRRAASRGAPSTASLTSPPSCSWTATSWSWRTRSVFCAQKQTF
jgi:hypothetical protein